MARLYKNTYFRIVSIVILLAYIILSVPFINLIAAYAEEDENTTQGTTMPSANPFTDDFPGNGRNVISSLEVYWWNILRKGYGEDNDAILDINENPAYPNTGYMLFFDGGINGGFEGPFLPGDYIILPLPQNREKNVLFTCKTSDWVSVDASIDGGGVVEDCFRWRLYNNADRYEIQIQLVNVPQTAKYYIPISFLTAEHALLNVTTHACVEDVYFAGRDLTGNNKNEREGKQPIRFVQLPLKMLGSWDTKIFSETSDRKVLWQIGVSASSVTSLTGWYDIDGQGNWYQRHDWGEYSWYNRPQMVVEEQLPPDVKIEALYIAARTFIPMSLTDTINVAGQPSNLQAWQSFVLADIGNGPEYRENGSPIIKETESPQKECSFARIYPEEAENYDAFRDRVLNAGMWNYGIHTDTDGIIRIIINFGDIGVWDSTEKQPKYSDLVLGKDITDPYTEEFTKVTNTPIPVFAKLAADFSIKRTSGKQDPDATTPQTDPDDEEEPSTVYTEADRDMLEEYFTLVYGDTNALGGSIANFMIDLHVLYPPWQDSGEVTNPGATMKFSDGNEIKSYRYNEPSGMLERGIGWSDVPIGWARLYKYDEESNKPLAGATVRLQRKSGNDWVYYDSETRYTNELGYVEWGPLATGDYRYVELNPPEGFIMQGTGEPVVIDGVPCYAVNFNVNESNVETGMRVFLSNTRKEVVKYRVHHYLETYDNSGGVQVFDFELEDDFLYYEALGVHVTALQNEYEDYVFDYALSEPTMKGVVIEGGNPDNDEEGILILRLFYRKKGEINFYKENIRGEALTGVGFNLYRCLNSGEHTHSIIVSDDENCCWIPIYDEPVVSDSSGQVKLFDVFTAEYMLVETKTLPGYQLPLGQWKVIYNVYDETLYIEAVSNNGNAPPAFYINEDDGKYHMQNFYNPDIPLTGGLGTLLFWVFGIILIGSAVLLFIIFYKKKE